MERDENITELLEECSTHFRHPCRRDLPEIQGEAFYFDISMLRY